MSTPRSTGSPVTDAGSPAIGTASKMGIGGTVLLGVLAALDAIIGDAGVDGDTRFLIASAVATAITTIGGRMYQQAALYLSRKTGGTGL